MKIETLEAINSLIADAENVRVEFKETTGQLERGMETLCAFLNGEGGTVLFGVTDKGAIIGQEVADATKRNIFKHLSLSGTLSESEYQIDADEVKIVSRMKAINRTSTPQVPYKYPTSSFTCTGCQEWNLFFKGNNGTVAVKEQKLFLKRIFKASFGGWLIRSNLS